MKVIKISTYAKQIYMFMSYLLIILKDSRRNLGLCYTCSVSIFSGRYSAIPEKINRVCKNSQSTYVILTTVYSLTIKENKSSHVCVSY